MMNELRKNTPNWKSDIAPGFKRIGFAWLAYETMSKSKENRENGSIQTQFCGIAIDLMNFAMQHNMHGFSFLYDNNMWM